MTSGAQKLIYGAKAASAATQRLIAEHQEEKRKYVAWVDPARRDPSAFVRAVYALVRAEINNGSEDIIEELALRVDDELARVITAKAPSGGGYGG